MPGRDWDAFGCSAIFVVLRRFDGAFVVFPIGNPICPFTGLRFSSKMGSDSSVANFVHRRDAENPKSKAGGR